MRCIGGGAVFCETRDACETEAALVGIVGWEEQIQKTQLMARELLQQRQQLRISIAGLGVVVVRILDDEGVYTAVVIVEEAFLWEKKRAGRE